MSLRAQTLLVVLGTLLFCCVELLFPFGRDQGNYAYPAWAWLEGQMPYRDVYVFKPPGTVWVHALALSLFGHSVQAVRVLDLGWTLATTLCIAAILRRWTGNPTGLVAPIAGVAYAFFYTDFSFWNTCQTDGWMNLPAAVAILVATRVWTGESRDWTLLIAGLAMGFAMTLKYTSAAFGLPLAGVLVAAALPERRFGQLAGRLALVGAGAAAVLGVTALWLWVNGAIPGFLDSQTVLVPAYVAKTGKTNSILDKFEILFDRYTVVEELNVPLGALAAGLVACGVRMRRDPRTILFVLWFLAGLASTMAQDKYFRYHFLSTLPGTAALGALALGGVLEAAARRGKGLAGGLGLIAACALVYPTNYASRWEVGIGVLGDSSRLRAFWETSSFKLDGGPMMDPYDCAKRVDALSQPGDRVFVWGFDPLINFLSRRFTVSRFLYNYPFAVSWGDPGYEAELMAALEATPPRLFVVASKDANKAVTGNPKDSTELLQDFEELSSFLAQRYEQVEVVNRYTIYRLR